MKKDHLLLVNANVITMDDALPRAIAIDIQGKNISSVINGNVGLINRQEAEVIDCKGKTVLPGFIDAHCHFIALAERLVLPDISAQHITSVDKIVEFVKNVADVTPPGNWIQVRGYQQFNLIDKRHPNRWDLDKATQSHPVCLSHVTGYIQILNSSALDKVKIDNYSEAPAGGMIERNLDNGIPDGILLNMRAYLSNFIPHVDDESLSRGVKLAADRYLSGGITSFQDASQANGLRRISQFRKYIHTGLIKSRVIMVQGLDSFLKDDCLETGLEDDLLKVNGVKIILTEASGGLNPPLTQINKIMLKIHERGKQAVIHAIEEPVIRIAAEAISRVTQVAPGKNQRHRIEHCSVCPPDLARFLQSLGVVVVTQPNFVYYNGERYLETIPEKERRYLYPFKTLNDAGINVAASSDSPVVPEDPLHGIYSAVTRRTEKGKQLEPAEKVSIMEALKMYTISAAYSAYEENIKGSVSPKKLADLIVLNGDPTKINPDEINDLEVEMVIIGGEIVYQNGF